MCKLDIIAGPLTEEQRWNRWLFNSLQDADFVVTMVIFGAVFVMAVSVLALFGVMLVRHFRKEAPAAEADGSIHVLPFLCSIIASIMFVLAVFAALMLLFSWEHMALYMLDYSFAFWYAAAMAALFGIALYFSPRAGKGFRIWNMVCMVISLLVVAVGVYFWLFILFTHGFVEAI